MVEPRIDAAVVVDLIGLLRHGVVFALIDQHDAGLAGPPRGIVKLDVLVPVGCAIVVAHFH